MLLHKKWNSTETITTRWHQACKVTQDAVNSEITYDAHTQTHTDTHSQSVQPVGMWLSTDVFRTSSGCSFPRIPSVGERAHSASNMVRSIENKLPANKTCLSQSKNGRGVFRSSHTDALLLPSEGPPDPWPVKAAKVWNLMLKNQLE